MITEMTEPCILCGDIQIPTEKSVQYQNDFKDHRTLHPLLEHSSFNWKITSLVLKWFQRWQNHAFFVETFIFQLRTQFSIEMILKIKELYILCGDIQIPTEKHSLFRNDYKGERPLHSLLGHSNFNWQNLTSLLGHSNSSGKSSSVSKWFQRWQNLTSFVGTFKFQLKKTVQYWNDLKDYRTLHPLRGDSDPN